MPDPASHRTRATTDGKFFRLGERKYFPKGVTYGPFVPNAQGEPFASPEPTARDFQSLRGLGANLIRVYHVPPRWFLDLAERSGLRVFVDIPWTKQACFLDTAGGRDEARRAVFEAARQCARHRRRLP